jgi:hypothetical protein
MSAPWEDPIDASTRFNLSSLVGCSVLIAVGGCHAAWQTSRRMTPAVRANIVAFNGEHAGQEFADVLVFNSKPVRQLRGCIGKSILANVVADPDSVQGALALEPVDDAMRHYANEWLKANPGRVEGMVKSAIEAYEMAEAARLAQPPTPHQTQPYVSQYASRPEYAPPRQTPPPPPSAPPPLPPQAPYENPPF